MTLLIMAAGTGGDFDGCKPLAPITEGGPSMIDFAIYDALRAGFDKIVLVVGEEALPLFEKAIDARFGSRVPVSYAVQRMDDIPAWTHVPRGREKPWGTAHAVLAARDLVHEPFGVVNADDFYGAEAYRLLAKHLSTVDLCADPAPFCMVGYQLWKTINPHGVFSRALCQVSEDGYLTHISERGRITDAGRAAISAESGRYQVVPYETVVSMNCWGFTPAVFEHLQRDFSIFAKRNASDRMAEFHLSAAVQGLLERQACTVRVYPTRGRRCGLADREDLAEAQNVISRLCEGGEYADLFPQD